MEGLSGAAILRAFREAGYSIRTQTFYQILREVRRDEKLLKAILDFPETRVIPRALHMLRPHKMPTKYWYVVEVHFIDEEDRIFKDTIGVFSNRPLSKVRVFKEARWQAERILEDEIKRESYGPKLVGVVDFKLIGAFERWD